MGLAGGVSILHYLAQGNLVLLGGDQVRKDILEESSDCRVRAAAPGCRHEDEVSGPGIHKILDSLADVSGRAGGGDAVDHGPEILVVVATESAGGVLSGPTAIWISIYEDEGVP